MGLQAPCAPLASPGVLSSSPFCSNKGEGIRQLRPRHANQERLRKKAGCLGHYRSKDRVKEKSNSSQKARESKKI